MALADLDTAPKPSDPDMGRCRMHPLKGGMRGLWSIAVAASRRIVFRFDDGDADGDGAADDAIVGTIVFSDEMPAVSYVSVEPSNASPVAPGANGSAADAATATARDRSGDPVSGQGIVLRSSNPTGSGDADGSTIRTTALNTGRSGAVRIGHSYSGDASVETLAAMWDGGTAGDLPTVGSDGTYTCGGGNVCGETKVNWIFASAATTQDAADVLSLDTDNDQAVIDPGGAGTPTSVNYDSNDFFTVTSDGDGEEVTTPMSLAGFEEAPAKALEKATDDNDVQTPELSRTSYEHHNPSDIASFTLDTTPS